MEQMNKWKLMVLAFILSAKVGCYESSFSGEQQQKRSRMTQDESKDKGAEGSADAIQEGDFIDDRVKDEADEVDEASIEAASSDCNESNLTEYRLATPEIQNGGNTTLVYIVDVSKCQEEDDLRFGWDINAVYQPPPGGSQVFTPDYSIPELGLEGTLKSIKGGDLFGNFGDNYAYLEMPEALVIQKSIAKLNIHITLPDGYLYTDLDGQELETVNTYLKLGPLKPEISLLDVLPSVSTQAPPAP